MALGELRLPADVVRRTFEAIRGAGKTEDAAAGLTPREREILVSFAQGMSYARIAEEREIKPVTVRNAIYGIQKKLSVGTMQELVLWCVRNGLLGDAGKDGRSCRRRADIRGSGRYSVSFAQGMSYARIAEEREIKPVTVRTQLNGFANAIYGIQKKLSVGTMQELVLWCVRNGLLGD